MSDCEPCAVFVLLLFIYLFRLIILLILSLSPRSWIWFDCGPVVSCRVSRGGPFSVVGAFCFRTHPSNVDDDGPLLGQEQLETAKRHGEGLT